MKKLVLFDLDGTLVTTGGAGCQALAKAAAKLYGKMPKFEHALISGRTDLDNFTLIYGLLHNGKKPAAAEIKKMAKAYVDQLPSEVKTLLRTGKYHVIPGVDKLLKEIAKDKDIIIALGTGNVEEGAFIKLKPSGLDKYFTLGGFGTDGHTREEMLKAAVKRAEKKFKTKLTPDQVYVIGDTHRDICAAKNCGFHNAVVTCSKLGDPKKIQRAAAELEEKDFKDLTTWRVWLGLKTDPKGVKRGSYIMPASAIEHVFFSRTGIDEDRLKMLRIKKYSDLPSGTIM